MKDVKPPDRLDELVKKQAMEFIKVIKYFDYEEFDVPNEQYVNIQALTHILAWIMGTVQGIERRAALHNIILKQLEDLAESASDFQEMKRQERREAKSSRH